MTALLAGVPATPPPPTQEPPAFLNIVNLLMTSAAEGSGEMDAFSASGAALQGRGISPAQLADALIRSMWKPGISGTNTAISPSTLQAAMMQSNGDTSGTQVSTVPSATSALAPSDEPSSSELSATALSSFSTLGDMETLRKKKGLEEDPPLGDNAAAQGTLLMTASAAPTAGASDVAPRSVASLALSSSDAQRKNSVSGSPSGDPGTQALPQAQATPSPLSFTAADNIAFRARLVEKLQSGKQRTQTTEVSAGPSSDATATADASRLEPQTVVRAVDRIERQRPDVPSPAVDPLGPSGKPHDASDATNFQAAHFDAAGLQAVAIPVAQTALSHSPAGNAAPAPAAEAAPVAQPQHSATVRPSEIAVRVASPDAQPIDVQIRQRAGTIQVAVRTPDISLQRTLRSDLPDLVGSLDRAGFRTESLTAGGDEPLVSLARTAAETNSDSSNSHGTGQDQPSNDAWRGSQSGGQQAGSFTGGDSRNARERLAQNWLEQMED